MTLSSEIHSLKSLIIALSHTHTHTHTHIVILKFSLGDCSATMSVVPTWMSNESTNLSPRIKRTIFEFCLNLDIKCYCAYIQKQFEAKANCSLCTNIVENSLLALNSYYRLSLRNVHTISKFIREDSEGLRVELAFIDSPVPSWYNEPHLELSFFQKNVIWSLCDRLGLTCHCFQIFFMKNVPVICRYCSAIIVQEVILLNDREQIPIKQVLKLFALARDSDRL